MSDKDVGSVEAAVPLEGMAGEFEGHEVGNPDCPECWCGCAVPCDCGGLKHRIFGEEIDDDNYTLLYRCDRCGGEEAPW